MTFSESLDDIVAENANGLLGKHPSWGRVRLREIATITNGAAFSSSHFKNHDGLPLIRIRDILGTETETRYVGDFDRRYLVQPGDLLVGMDGDFNSTLWRGPVGLLNQRVCKIEVDQSRYRKKFLAYALPGYLSAINARTSSLTVKHLSSRTVADIPLPAPPLETQGAIADKLDELFSDLDAGVAALECAKANLERYRAAVLKAAVEAKLTEQWRQKHPDVEPASELLKRILAERRKRWEEEQLRKYEAAGRKPPKGWRDTYREPVRPDPSQVYALPSTWIWTTVDALGEVVSGVTKGQRPKAGTSRLEVPYLRVANVQGGFLDLSVVKTILATPAEIEQCRLRPGDVLFTEGGDRDKLGRGWVWKGEIDKCIHQNHIFRLRLFSSECVPELVSVHGNTFGRRWFQTTGKQTTNLASINQRVLRRFPVPLAPSAEQGAIREAITQTEASTERVRGQLGGSVVTASRLGQAILARAFAGYLVS